MRIIFPLTTFLLATGNALATDAGMRHLRSADNIDAQDEERVNFKFDFSWWDNFAHKLPTQFEEMRTKPAHLNYIFESWRQGWTSFDDAVAYMTKEGLTEKAIDQFLTAYKLYIKDHPFI